MSSTHRAFPILQSSGVSAKTLLVEVAEDILPRVHDTLCRRSGASSGNNKHSRRIGRGEASRYEGGPVSLTLSVGGTIDVPLACLGRTAGAGRDDNADLVLHCPGLPGAFLAPFTALTTCRGQWRVTSALSSSSSSDKAQSYAEQLGTLCCLEAVEQGWKKETVMDRLYTITRRRHFSVSGTQRLLEKGMQIAPEALQLSFPYHCGGAQATKRYFDISEDVCHVFGPHGAHGTRCLSRYGTAVSVGVTVGDGEDLADRLPQLFWHPTGAMAACLAPVLSGCAVVPVGHVKLPYNGPLRDSDLLSIEDPRRYMQLRAEDSSLDTTTWLCEGLFGVHPTTAWRGPPQRMHGDHPLSILGVGFNEAHKEMELFLRDEKTGDVIVADDV